MKKGLSMFMAAVMLLSIAFTALAAGPAKAANALVWFDSDSTVDPDESAVMTLVVEGLGTDPYNTEIVSVTVAGSDEDVAEISGLSAGTAYTPNGGSMPTGISYSVSVLGKKAGITTVTATVVTVSGETYTGSCFVTVRGIVVRQREITLEAGETRVVFAERYGFSESQSSRNLMWRKDGADLTWITMGVHGTRHQNEAYYIHGQSAGVGEVTVSLSGSTYSDTIVVNVVPAKTVSVKQNGEVVTSTIDLGAVSSVTLDAVCDGFSDAAAVTWESSRPDLVSVTPSGRSAIISQVGYSDTVVAVKVTATENDVTRSKTVYCDVLDPNPRSLKIVSARLSGGNITIREGETLTLSADVRGDDPTATRWSATTGNGRVPVKLNSTVGKSITITGRSATTSPVAVHAANGTTDTVYVTVTPAPTEKPSVRIVSTSLGADGCITMRPGDAAALSVELNHFAGLPTVTWSATVAPNSQNTSSGMSASVELFDSVGLSTVISARTSSADFARVRVSVSDGAYTYTDEIYVKVTDRDIVNTARYIQMFRGDAITFSTLDDQSADWESNSQKAYFGSVSTRPTHETGAYATLHTVNNTTTNPVRIDVALADNPTVTDSVYVSVVNAQWSSVSFNLNGAYGTAPDDIVMSTTDSKLSFVLPEPDAAYPSDDGDYSFVGWSAYADAASPDSSRLIYFPGEEYTVSSGQNVTLYAVWAKQTENAMFTIRLSGDIGAEPGTQASSTYANSCVYIEDALNPAGFYFNVNGVDSHLAKMPSDEDIARALNIAYDNGTPVSYHPETDRVIWYVIKRIADDSGGATNWHVDGVLVRGEKVSLTYDKNTPVANVANVPNPPRAFYDAGDYVSILQKVPTCVGESFIGWNTQPDGRGRWYTSTGSLYNGDTASQTVETNLMIEEDTVLYAIWEGRPYYDINGDGVENGLDYDCVVAAALGDSTLTAEQTDKADLNRDGMIDVLDCRLFKLLLQGKDLPA